MSMAREHNLILLFVGPSGSGKSAVADAMRKFGYRVLNSYTTRPKRKLLEKGHIFVNDEEFNRLIGICAYTEYNGYRYCATNNQVNCSDIYIIDPDGVDYFLDHYNGNKKIVTVKFKTKKWPLLKRLCKRSWSQGLKRFKKDQYIFGKYYKPADIYLDTSYGTVNDSVIYLLEELWDYVFLNFLV